MPVNCSKSHATETIQDNQTWLFPSAHSIKYGNCWISSISHKILKIMFTWDLPHGVESPHTESNMVCLKIWNMYRKYFCNKKCVLHEVWYCKCVDWAPQIFRHFWKQVGSECLIRWCQVCEMELLASGCKVERAWMWSPAGKSGTVDRVLVCWMVWGSGIWRRGGGFQLAGGKVCYHFGYITSLWTRIIY